MSAHSTAAPIKKYGYRDYNFSNLSAILARTHTVYSSYLKHLSDKKIDNLEKIWQVADCSQSHHCDRCDACFNVKPMIAQAVNNIYSRKMFLVKEDEKNLISTFVLLAIQSIDQMADVKNMTERSRL